MAEARLAVQMSDISISRFAQRVAQQHGQRLNRDIPITGSHFEQKCRGVKVDGQTALVDLVRHLHLAPLKARLATDPVAYLWSSHRVYLGLEEASWLAVTPVLSHFEQAYGDAMLGYTNFMSQGAENIEALAAQVDTSQPKASGKQVRPTRNERRWIDGYQCLFRYSLVLSLRAAPRMGQNELFVAAKT